MIHEILLSIGIIMALGILAVEFGILCGFFKGSAIGVGTKTIAIFGILFMATAVISGSAVTGFITKESFNGNVDLLSTKVEQSNQGLLQVKKDLQNLKSSIIIETSSSTNQKLLDLIESLENKLDNLSEDNEDLEDDLDDLKDEIEDLYTLIPGGHY